MFRPFREWWENVQLIQSFILQEKLDAHCQDLIFWMTRSRIMCLSLNFYYKQYLCIPMSIATATPGQTEEGEAASRPEYSRGKVKT
jgi:hypothetical protein